MSHSRFLKPLGKAFRFYAGLALAVFLLQLVGLAVYFINGWSSVRQGLSSVVVLYAAVAVVLILVRSCLWIRIYWSGASTFSILHREGDSPELTDRLAPILKTLVRLLVASGILEMCFIPVIFLSDRLLPFALSGLWLGLVYLAMLVLPQAFGTGAFMLAYLARQYGQLLGERSLMKEEIELTI
jgi:hypothetical protein